GTRVLFWTATGQYVYATVRSSTRLQDGTQLLQLRTDDNRDMTLPCVAHSISPLIFD
ncbi:hypothetical protein FA15DRAFT_581043, partial [Coprinopsis marcescibilis]